MYVRHIGSDYVLRLCLRVSMCARAVQAQQMNLGRSLCKSELEERGRERRALTSPRRMQSSSDPPAVVNNIGRPQQGRLIMKQME